MAILLSSPWVVSASDAGDGASLNLVELGQAGVTHTPQRTLDFSRSHVRLDFADAACQPLGSPGSGWAAVGRLLDRGRGAIRVGAGGRCRCRAGDGQGIRHGPLCLRPANRLLSGHQAQAGTSLCQQHPGAFQLLLRCLGAHTDAPDLPLAAATARVSATQAYYYASKENIPNQTHGGMGYTWEFDCQFFYRRAKLLSVNIGSEGHWQDRLITAVEQSNVA